MELQVVLNTFASDIFRKQADYDYISARANYRMQLRQQFLWSAHQAIEKYLKAILLFNGKSARYYFTNTGSKRKEYGHDLDALNREVKKISDLGYVLEPKDEKFLSYLSSQGGANRYLSTTAHNPMDVIHQIDSLVWNVRRYCQYFWQEKSYRNLLVNDPYIKMNPHKFSLFGGELEAILKRDSSDAAKKALTWVNLHYGKKRKVHVAYTQFSSFEVPPNEREWQGVDWKVIEEYVKLT